ncbi:hypothetical protein [Selenomonas ruminantium]|uniref:hypothetical protein n=1 Tax=Selenomonas ruminantium TaxID=971 RepID=UPI0026EF176F|nr:hypothetical protein [Selenomonas ruminantium]
MTIEEAKKILPPELKYPLPDGVIDNLINVLAIPLKQDFGDDEELNNKKGMDYVIMAALIELKERREQEDKELAERALEIEREDWERDSDGRE